MRNAEKKATAENYSVENNSVEKNPVEKILVFTGRILLFILLIYLFLVAVKMFGDSSQLFTKQYQTSWESLIGSLNNPFVGLCLGIIATALMQSSSATTSLAVAMVATGQIPLTGAVSIVMGANIGTSLTCMLVALGHINNRITFNKAFSAALIQDNFNLLTVALCFTLEYCFGYLSRTATWIVSCFSFAPAAETAGEAVSTGGGSWFCNPIPVAVAWPVDLLKAMLLDGAKFSISVSAIIMCILGLIILFFALVKITQNMKTLLADKIEVWLNQVLSKNGYLGILIGTVVTMIVQSSSITTSLMVPLVAAGVLKVRTIYPIVLGANIGTTITAILAAMAYAGTPGGNTGLQLAFVHLLFNLTGVMCFYPVPWLRLPVFMTEFLSKFLCKSRRLVLLWISMIFLVIPGVGLWLFS